MGNPSSSTNKKPIVTYAIFSVLCLVLAGLCVKFYLDKAELVNEKQECSLENERLEKQIFNKDELVVSKDDEIYDIRDKLKKVRDERDELELDNSDLNKIITTLEPFWRF